MMYEWHAHDLERWNDVGSMFRTSVNIDTGDMASQDPGRGGVPRMRSAASIRGHKDERGLVDTSRPWALCLVE